MKIIKHIKSDWFKYAFETLAVVIGILAAFALDNWNDERKAKQFEHKILNDVQLSLEGNFWSLNNSIRCNRKAVLSCQIILEHFDNNLPYHDSLDNHFSKAIQWCNPSLRNAGYESLKSYGINIIGSNSIREAIGIYNVDWMQQLANRQEEYFFNTASPILTQLFETVAMRSEMHPFDYEALKKSNEYRSILNTCIAYREDQIHWHEEWHRSLKRLEELIISELNGK